MSKKKELSKMYAKMAEESQRSMEGCIEKYLKDLAASDANFAAKFDEKRVEKAVSFVIEMAREILNGTSGEVADDVCYKMARDYFEDRLWEDGDDKEPEEKPKAEEKPKKATAKKKPEVITASVKDAEPVKAEEEKPAPVRKSPTSFNADQLDLFGFGV